MIRRWLSNFIRKNINKIKDLGMKLIIVAIVVLFATILLSNNNNDSSSEEKKEVYRPTEAVIKGEDVSKEQYENDSNTVKKFLEYCNTGKVEEAYDLLNDGCKENKYTTIDIFKEAYYNYIFNEKKDYNIQAWISTDQYTVYRIRYMKNLLEIGKYEENGIYEDYITLIKGFDSEKISIGSFIMEEDLNVETKTKEIEAKVLKKYIYLDYEEYEIQIKNITDKVILMDDLKSNQTIKLIGDISGAYTAYTNKLYIDKLTIQPNDSKLIKISFKKEVSSNNRGEYINFYKTIKDYDAYMQDLENYKDTINVKINVR